MAASLGPDLIEDGLILSLDAGDINSVMGSTVEVLVVAGGGGGGGGRRGGGPLNLRPIGRHGIGEDHLHSSHPENSGGFRTRNSRRKVSHGKSFATLLQPPHAGHLKPSLLKSTVPELEVRALLMA